MAAAAAAAAAAGVLPHRRAQRVHREHHGPRPPLSRASDRPGSESAGPGPGRDGSVRLPGSSQLVFFVASARPAARSARHGPAPAGPSFRARPGRPAQTAPSGLPGPPGPRIECSGRLLSDERTDPLKGERTAPRSGGPGHSGRRHHRDRDTHHRDRDTPSQARKPGLSGGGARHISAPEVMRNS